MRRRLRSSSGRAELCTKAPFRFQLAEREVTLPANEEVPVPGVRALGDLVAEERRMVPAQHRQDALVEALGERGEP
jgi:hypothetical protein